MKSPRKRDYKAKRWNQEELKHLDSIVEVSRENKEFYFQHIEFKFVLNICVEILSRQKRLHVRGPG